MTSQALVLGTKIGVGEQIILFPRHLSAVRRESSQHHCVDSFKTLWKFRSHGRLPGGDNI